MNLGWDMAVLTEVSCGFTQSLHYRFLPDPFHSIVSVVSVSFCHSALCIVQTASDTADTKLMT
jgi:hypothetical protein